MASSYGTASRAPRLENTRQQAPPAPMQPSGKPPNAPVYRDLADIPDYLLRQKVERMLSVLGSRYSVNACMHALYKTSSNYDRAMTYVVEEQEKMDADELNSMSPVQRKGVAQSVSQQQHTPPVQPVRAAAKQQIQAKRTIAEKYGAARKPVKKVVHSDDDSDEGVVQRRRPAPEVVDLDSPPSSPPLRRPQLRQRTQKKTIVESEDDDDEAIGRDASDESEGEPEEVEVVEVEDSVHEMREARVLKLLNESSVKDLAELTAKPEENIQFVIEKRPFHTLDDIRAVVQETLTKAGKKSKKTRNLGEQLVEECVEVMSGYDAVDKLVVECEKLAAPLQEALKAWGVGDMSSGELQLMNLEEAHDSGIGTPASSCTADEAPTQKGIAKSKCKTAWIGQPENMNPDLLMKDYQLVGLNWLHMLFKKELSCILADDMGLGKTCQIIGFLSQLQLEKVDGVHLIIVPGSTLENWLREFERFAPDMVVRPYYGSQGERAELQYSLEQDWENIDAIVTTYDMAVKKDDNKFLRKMGPFSVCVYDEAHMLRNPNSDRYSQLTRIGADFKVLLTGTPLQNNLQELIAILAFIMPGLFQEKRDDLDFLFKHKATTKDTSSAALLSNERVARARTMMTPFILRRKKQQVLDLPKKHSRVEYCDMTETQASFYADLYEEAQRVFAEKHAPGAKKTAKGASSNVIMALRKAAIHPLMSRRIYDDKKIDKIAAALKKDEEFAGNPLDMIRAYLNGEAKTGQTLRGGDYGIHKFCDARPFLAKRFALKKQEWMDSGKVVKFKELITRYVAAGDRTLVFSQFTTLMDILEGVLETLDIPFMRLDGSTNMADRQEMIDKFYADPSIKVFMLSTRAGGAGINLAAANRVVIFDSGFNPQDDIQAENRAHRVGQTREVEVVRLVTRGTIEEQIHALGESKLALDERVAGEGGAAAADVRAADAKGEELVERMFVRKLKGEGDDCGGEGEGKGVEKTKKGPEDLKDAFKKGLEGEGVAVVSKQAQF
jgi:SWI/SNF-related matrix-associated actin-dependent regulator 1 of chromatin subfamily A